MNSDSNSNSKGNDKNKSINISEKSFCIKDKVQVLTDSNQQKFVKVTTPWSKAMIYLQGAHLTSYSLHKNIKKGLEQGESVFWLSPISTFREGVAIRGGVPICWPWFGKKPDAPELPQHGFARNSHFNILKAEELANGAIKLILRLSDNAKTRAIWPFKFHLDVCFIVGKSLSIELKTTNCSTDSFEISEAIHSYFRVEDISQTSLAGLEKCTYFDQLKNTHNKQAGVLHFNQETDNIYRASQNTLVINEHDKCCSFQIKQYNANSTVVWNPWINKSNLMSDFPDLGYINMLCVEAGNIGDLVQVGPQCCHAMRQTIKIIE